MWLNLDDTNEVVVDVKEHLPPGHIVYHAHAYHNFTWNIVVPPDLDYAISSGSPCRSSFTIDNRGKSPEATLEETVAPSSGFDSLDVRPVEIR